jgi:hypothetical protein
MHAVEDVRQVAFDRQVALDQIAALLHQPGVDELPLEHPLPVVHRPWQLAVLGQLEHSLLAEMQVAGAFCQGHRAALRAIYIQSLHGC